MTNDSQQCEAPADSARLTLDDLVGDRRPISEIANALRKTERSISKFIRRHKIPYVTVQRVRYVDPAAVRQAIERTETEVTHV